MGFTPHMHRAYNFLHIKVSCSKSVIPGEKNNRILFVQINMSHENSAKNQWFKTKINAVQRWFNAIFFIAQKSISNQNYDAIRVLIGRVWLRTFVRFLREKAGAITYHRNACNVWDTLMFLPLLAYQNRLRSQLLHRHFSFSFVRVFSEVFRTRRGLPGNSLQQTQWLLCLWSLLAWASDTVCMFPLLLPVSWYHS